jgi:hypothetical protein
MLSGTIEARKDYDILVLLMGPNNTYLGHMLAPETWRPERGDRVYAHGHFHVIKDFCWGTSQDLTARVGDPSWSALYAHVNERSRLGCLLELVSSDLEVLAIAGS